MGPKISNHCAFAINLCVMKFRDVQKKKAAVKGNLFFNL